MIKKNDAIFILIYWFLTIYVKNVTENNLDKYAVVTRIKIKSLK